MSVAQQHNLEAMKQACELCHCTAAREIYTATDRLRNSDCVFSIAVCERCKVLRTLPEMSDDELAEFYPQDYWGQQILPSEGWVRASQSEKTDFIGRCGLKRGRVVDVGCGSGHFLRALGPDLWERYGVETGSVAAEAAASWLGRERVIAGDLTGAAFPESAFDLMTFWSSLEHSTKPRATLLEARRILRNGGSVVVQVPNAASYQAAVFGGDWFAIDAPRHRYHFTPARLQQLLRDTGFEVYRMTLFSRQHNAHALRQSLKARLGAARSRPGLALFLLCIPFIKPVDFAMTILGKGATMTVAARAV
jgi:SAM-dependent methyltransferase